MRQSLGAAGAVSERLAAGYPAHALWDELLRPSHQPAYDPHPIGDEGIVGGMVDVRFDHRTVGPELPAARNLQRAGQLDGAVVEKRKGPCTDHIRPTDEGGIVGRRLQVKPTELPLDERVGDEVLGLFIAPSVESLHEAHPQDRFHRRGVASEPF